MGPDGHHEEATALAGLNTELSAIHNRRGVIMYNVFIMLLQYNIMSLGNTGLTK